MAAYEALDRGRESADAISLATVEALLAIFHQLKDMQATSVTITDLRNEMDSLGTQLRPQ